MARESFASRAQRQQRSADPVKSGAWRVGVIEKIQASGQREIRVTDALAVDNGWSEDHLRAMCSGSGGMGILTMRSVFEDVEPAYKDAPTKRFVEHVWDVR